jgi:hypothetical protein
MTDKSRPDRGWRSIGEITAELVEKLGKCKNPPDPLSARFTLDADS